MRASIAIAEHGGHRHIGGGGNGTRTSLFGGLKSRKKDAKAPKMRGKQRSQNADSLPRAQEGIFMETNNALGNANGTTAGVGMDSSGNYLEDLFVGTLTDTWPYMSRPEIRLRNLREVKVLGRGAFGLVRCVRDKLSGQTGTAIGGGKEKNEYALKALAKPALKKLNSNTGGKSGRGLDKIIRERDAQVLCGDHPMVCGLINTYEVLMLYCRRVNVIKMFINIIRIP